MSEIDGHYMNQPDIAAYVPQYEWLRTARDTIANDMADAPQNGWTAARVIPGANFDAEDFISVPQFNELFQSSNDPQLFVFCSHDLSARRILMRRPV